MYTHLCINAFMDAYIHTNTYIHSYILCHTLQFLGPFFSLSQSSVCLSLSQSSVCLSLSQSSVCLSLSQSSSSFFLHSLAHSYMTFTHLSCNILYTHTCIHIIPYYTAPGPVSQPVSACLSSFLPLFCALTLASRTFHFAAGTNAFAHLFLFLLLVASSPETVPVCVCVCKHAGV
jgi:hypothetical protein